MIVIYNRSGGLIGVVGALFGFLAFAMTRSLAAGLAITGLVWLAGGLAWKFWKVAPGQRRSFPSVFFIPLFVWALPVLFLLTPIALLADLGRRHLNGDLRAELLTDDESSLRRGEPVGDQKLADQVYDGVVKPSSGSKVASLSDVRVLARVKDDAVLVLVRTKKLKDLAPPDRVKILDAVSAALAGRSDLAAKQQYIGVMGAFAVGAMRTPQGTSVGEVLPEDPLWGYYGAPPPPPPPPPTPNP